MTKYFHLTIRSLLSALLAVPVLWPAIAQAQAQETVCIQCHGGQPGRLGEPIGQWQGSIHAQNGISCHGCHGGDPTDFAMAMSPERGFIGVPDEAEIPEFCGRCHVGVKEDYLQSAHGQALDAGGPQCVTCHGNHAVQKTTIDLINAEDCSRCHEYGRAERIKSALAETDRMISGLETELAQLHRTGIATKPLQDQIFAARNKFHRLFHSVDVEKIQQETAGVQAELGKVEERVAAYHADFSQRRLWGGGVTLALVLMGVLFMLLRKTYHDEEQEHR
ncbi:c-type cytochrome [Desulfuromonas versatilis]|uniref:C-type cytochrome n=1 Tax=Desulfuromonas versatilis TaxID=2802975 RepID=A0ABM8HUH6_9BACT|nr:cytochrome c3 family protein [Desulfuromonas versatilis]BCR04145.1 c-type cytochrome [Desulfuromonas versatilis]